MQFFQFPDKDISVRDGELRFAKFADGVEHIERPAALFDSDFFEGFDAPEFCSDPRFPGGLVFPDDRNPSLDGNPMQRDVAANPARPPGRHGQRIPFDDGRRRKRKRRNDQQISMALPQQSQAERQERLVRFG